VLVIVSAEAAQSEVKRRSGHLSLLRTDNNSAHAHTRTANRISTTRGGMVPHGPEVRRARQAVRRLLACAVLVVISKCHLGLAQGTFDACMMRVPRCNAVSDSFSEVTFVILSGTV